MVRARALSDIDLVNETMDGYARRVYRAVALLGGHRVVISDRQIRSVLIRARHHKTMEGMDEDSVMAYLRVGLQEAMQTDSPDSQLRQDVLFQLVQEGNQETLRARPQVSTSSGDAGRTSTPLTREALLSAATPARTMPLRQPARHVSRSVFAGRPPWIGGKRSGSPRA